MSDEILSSLPNPMLSENATTILETRYLVRDDKNKIIETPKEMFWRVAKNISLAENESVRDEWSKKFYTMMANLDFLPNSPCLMNAGRPLQQLSGCYVLPIEDSLDSIFETIKNTAKVHKSGGGTGFSFSKLRPAGAIIKTTGGVSSGPISFMRVFNVATDVVVQGGKRRGANMGILRIDHPDIQEFIKCKDKEGEFSNFNISVAMTNEFMTKVLEHEPNSEKLFNEICEHAWKNGEPGIIFIDKINEKNTLIKLGEMESTNPCSEVPLFPYESCVLGSINLSNFVIPATATHVAHVDINKLQETVNNAVRFLDNVIDMNKYPLTQIENTTKSNRKIGLGVMGFAHMLIKLGIPYNSTLASTTSSEIMRIIYRTGIKYSKKLAEEKGSFPNWQHQSNPINIRNATITTIAPTGSIAMIANTSYGIEPMFMPIHTKHILNGKEIYVIDPILQKLMGDELTPELIKKISSAGSLTNIDEIPKTIQQLFITASEISYETHIRIQQAFQEYTDNAVSKTINFPNTATVDDVKKAYLSAFQSNLKGLTVYRQGSREQEVITKSNQSNPKPSPIEIKPRKRPNLVHGITIKKETGCGNLYITINNDEKGAPFEVFAHMGNSGGCSATQAESTGRLVSLALRSNVSLKSIIKQLKGLRCPGPAGTIGNITYSCPDAIAKALEEVYKEDDQEPQPSKPSELHGNTVGVCPMCGSSIVHATGCIYCTNPECHYTKGCTG